MKFKKKNIEVDLFNQIKLLMRRFAKILFVVVSLTKNKTFE